MSANKQLKQIVQRAEAQGWRVERTKGDHLKWLSPIGGIIFSASTPSDHRAFRNHISNLKKHGFIGK